MNAANYDGEDKYTRVCLQPATDQPREIVLPDASGVVITDGSPADLRSLPGLRAMEGQSTMMYRCVVARTQLAESFFLKKISISPFVFASFDQES